MKKLIFQDLTPIVLVLLLPLLSQAAFDDLGAGARGPGMGNAMAAVADDVYAVHYNPAGLGTLKRPQFGASHTQLYMGLTDDSNLGTSFLGYAHPLGEGKYGTVAGAWNVFSLDGSLYRENTIYLSYGRLWLSHPRRGDLFMGTTLKYLYSTFGSFTEASNATDGFIPTGKADPVLTGNSRHGTFDADIGMLYRFMKHYHLGLEVTHIPRSDMAFRSQDCDRLPLGVKFGFNYKSLISNLVAQFETKKAPDGSQDKIFTAAAERWFPRFFVGDFGVRGGMGMGSREYKQLSLGLSYRSRRVQIDYGFALPIRTVASTAGSHRMALTFRFGRPTEEEETLEMLLEAMRGLKALPPPAPIIQKTTVTVYVTPELSAKERAIAEKLARSEDAIRGKRYREAYRLSAAVLDMDAGVTAGWQNLGIAFLGMERFDNSLRAWQKAYNLETSPAIRAAIEGYMKSISRLKRQHGAVSRVSRPKPLPAVKMPGLSQQEVDDLLNRGVDHYINYEFEKARQVFRKIVQSNPDNAEARNALRRVEENLK